MQEQCEAQGQSLLGEMESWLVWTYDDDLPDVGLGLCVLCVPAAAMETSLRSAISLDARLSLGQSWQRIGRGRIAPLG